MKRILPCFLAMLLILSRAAAEPVVADDSLLLYICPLQRADAMILQQGGRTMLIDTGEAKDAAVVCQALDDLGITRIDFILNTHPHHDHLGGLPELLERYEVGLFYTGFPNDFSAQGVVQQEAVAALRRKGVPIIHIDNGQVLFVGDVKISVLRCKNFSSVNAQSLMLLLEFGQNRLLLTADVTANAQNSIAASTSDLKADILKAPHHGRERMNAAFLNSVAPSYVFITNGISDSKDLRSQLEKRGIPYGLTRNGFICLIGDGQQWWIQQSGTDIFLQP